MGVKMPEDVSSRQTQFLWDARDQELEVGLGNYFWDYLEFKGSEEEGSWQRVGE
jgi:hypothetical protein